MKIIYGINRKHRTQKLLSARHGLEISLEASTFRIFFKYLQARCDVFIPRPPPILRHLILKKKFCSFLFNLRIEKEIVAGRFQGMGG